MLFENPNSPTRLGLLFSLLMANNSSEAQADDFLEQILGLPNFASAEANLAGGDGGLTGAQVSPSPMMLQLNSGDGSGHIGAIGGSGGYHGAVFPLGLSLEQGKAGLFKPEEASGSGKRFRDDMVDSRGSSVKNVRYSAYKEAFKLGGFIWLARNFDTFFSD